ncbi:MAG TPA: DUF3417 domain-containing protein, partial [bacterium]|nr:DUF3417 domain-containing protein [bacterium]
MYLSFYAIMFYRLMFIAGNFILCPHVTKLQGIMDQRLNDLTDLAYNLWWSWNQNAQSVFRE